MLKKFVLCLAAAAACAPLGAAADPVRAAAQRAITVVEHGASGFYKSQECFSCHDLGLPVMAFQMARRRGLAIDEAVVAQVAAKGLLHSPDLSSIDAAVQARTIVDPAASDGWALVAADTLGVRPNTVTGAMAQRIAHWQRPDGHFPTLDARPPQSSSLFTATAVASRALRAYMPAALGRETGEHLARAKTWLPFAAQPRSTEDATFRLFGLSWTGATAAECARAARDLLALQRPDGGWSEIPHMASEAYSTGEALVALAQAGAVPPANAAWQKGLRFLLSTQQDDGSWHVRTRMVSPAAVSPPYFESGFAYGHDQFLSTAATAWAAMGLLTALPETGAATPPPPAALKPQGLQPWMDAALFGGADDLKALLDRGLNPNSKTAGGTTLLMMAAHDPAKVKLLLSRGADARAKAADGFTAAMVAATYPGTAESLKSLLAAGAEAKPGTGVLFNASPLMMAAMAGDGENIALPARARRRPQPAHERSRDVPHHAAADGGRVRRPRAGSGIGGGGRGHSPDGPRRHDGSPLGGGDPPSGRGEGPAGRQGRRKRGG